MTKWNEGNLMGWGGPPIKKNRDKKKDEEIEAVEMKGERQDIS